MEPIVLAFVLARRPRTTPPANYKPAGQPGQTSSHHAVLARHHSRRPDLRKSSSHARTPYGGFVDTCPVGTKRGRHRRSAHRIDRPSTVIAMPRTYTAEEKTVALATYAEHGLARAHDEHEIPKATLRKWALGAGMDTSAIAGASADQTRAASTARSARCEMLRLELRESFLVAAADMLDRLDEEHIDFRGQQAREVTFPKAPADACRNYVTAAAILIDKYRLEVGEATDRSETLALERSAQSDERLAKVVELVTERQAIAS